MAMSMSTTYTGRVVSVNERGLKLDGHDDWYNVSRFAPAFEMPSRGETVTVTVDSKGFLRSCERLDGPAPIAGGSDARINAQGRSCGAPHHGAPNPTAGPSEKDRTITRLAVLKAAAEFGASRPDLKSGDVLKIADSWVAWVERAPEDDLTDAF